MSLWWAQAPGPVDGAREEWKVLSPPVSSGSVVTAGVRTERAWGGLPWCPLGLELRLREQAGGSPQTPSPGRMPSGRLPAWPGGEQAWASGQVSS